MNFWRRVLASGLIFLIFFSILPITTGAQAILPPGLPGITDLPPVPVSDNALRSKEAGLTIFGVTIPGLTWDALAIFAARIAIEQLVNSTLDWINSGFEGGPAYVRNPGEYFMGTADIVAGEFIAGSDLAFLCSPFQTQIRLSLLSQYNYPTQYQCTFTEIAGNLEAFYGDFSQGGWDGWLNMTQTNANNPYGAYIEAQVELDRRISQRLGLSSQQLDWGGGFLSWSECTRYAPGTAECIERGPVQTPGTVIEGQLENVLGTGVRKLELIDEFDELVSALISQLLQRAVFSVTGLLN